MKPAKYPINQSFQDRPAVVHDLNIIHSCSKNTHWIFFTRLQFINALIWVLIIHYFRITIKLNRTQIVVVQYITRTNHKFQITNLKYQTNHNNRNSKSQTCSGYRKTNRSKFWSLDIGICNLFVICLPAVFLAGCLSFEILKAGACVLDARCGVTDARYSRLDTGFS